MMHYAHVVMEAKELGFASDEAAKKFARKVVTTAALLTMMPEDVLAVWSGKSHSTPEERKPVVDVMRRLNSLIPDEV